MVCALASAAIRSLHIPLAGAIIGGVGEEVNGELINRKAKKMKKMLFCGFACAMCVAAAAAERPVPAKTPGERPRMEAKKPGDAAAKKPDDAAKPSAEQPGEKPAAAKKPGDRKTSAGARAPQGRAARGARRGAPGAAGRQRMRAHGVAEADTIPMSPAERRLVEAIEDAETSRALSRLMPQALSSKNPEVRQSMVDALEDQGFRSVNDLACFIADPDRDVADSAFSAWASALEDVSPSRRLAAIRAAARILQPRSDASPDLRR